MIKVFYKIILGCLVVLLLGNSLTYANENSDNVPPKEWSVWLDGLKREMIAKGISQKTIDEAYKNKNYYHKVSAVVEKDKKQTEFVLTTCAYVNRLVSKDRVKQGRNEYNKISKKYNKLEKEFNVPLNYLIAFWAVETNFGKNKGTYHLIDSLTNLSYKNRRAKFFKSELYNVLKIMDKNHLNEEKMLGSWAGAMGHFQFMPSTYNNYAVDYDENGVADIWDSFDDALASAANYLSKLGWKPDEDWGTRVNLPWNFDFKLVGRQTTKKVSEWHALGIKTYSDKNLSYDGELRASIILPDGRKGPAYIIFSNFKRVMIWNKSDNYALAIVILADYIKYQQRKWVPLEATTQYTLNSDEITKIQSFYNSISNKKIKADGKLGPKTREAIKYIQHKAKIPEDGYPDYQLLNKINNYNPKYGFSTPVQPRKAVKK